MLETLKKLRALNLGSCAGHTVMLSNPEYADLVHTIGVASLAADDKQIWHLIKIYWYTIEFGVVEEGDEVKAFGAGRQQFSYLPAQLCSPFQAPGLFVS